MEKRETSRQMGDEEWDGDGDASQPPRRAGAGVWGGELCKGWGGFGGGWLGYISAA